MDKAWVVRPPHYIRLEHPTDECGASWSLTLKEAIAIKKALDKAIADFD